MTKKTVKDLTLEISQLKEDHTNLKTKFDTLAKKYENLEKKYEDCLNIKKISSFKCDKCGEEFETLWNLNSHKKNHAPSNDMLRCDVCERLFNEEWKLSAHIKTHEKYACNQCEKTFKNLDVKGKHVKISHEDVKIFCHFFNNNLECPYNEECIFIHKDSEMCRYGATCERKKCMYKHGDNDDDENDEVETDGEENDDDDQADKTFVNPFRSNSRESLHDNDESENPKNEELKNINVQDSGEELFKCELCIFETKDSKRFKRHKFENHSVKGRYVCSGCHEEFLTRKHFNSHNYKGCNPSFVAEVKSKQT